MKLKRMFLYIAVLATMAWAWGCNEEDEDFVFGLRNDIVFGDDDDSQ